MTGEPRDLMIREHRRLECALDARVRVAPEDAARVVLARSLGDPAEGVAGTVVDCSAGGLGLRMRVFLPKGCRLLVRVDASGVAGLSPGWSLEAGVSVQRAMMVARDPQYYLGTSFVAVDEPARARVNELLSALAAQGGRLRA